jgi:lysophospholipase L1-like esterase
MRRHNAHFYAGAKVDAAPIPNIQLVFEGDSISSYPYGELNNYTSLLIADITADNRCGMVVSRFANPGDGLNALIARGSTVDASHIDGRLNILSVMIGSNDLSSMTPSTWLTSYASYLSARMLVFERVLVMTITSRGSGTTATNRHAANTGIVGFQGVNCTAVADVGNVTARLGADSAYLDTNIIADGVHPTTLGYSYLAEDILPTLRMLIGY